jgi:hypothetical protein
MALLLGAASGDGGTRPPHEPFAKWNAETTAEKRLDALISDVVTTLERDGPDPRFDGWRSRNIGSEYRALHLTVPRSANGRYTGRNFLFQNGDFGTYFYARFNLPQLKFFVPSACRERTAAGRRSDVVRLHPEGVPYWSSHKNYTDRERRDDVRRTMTPIYEMPCGSAVKLLLYDSDLVRRFEYRQRHPGAGDLPHSDHFWIGVAIGYSRPRGTGSTDEKIPPS